MPTHAHKFYKNEILEIMPGQRFYKCEFRGCEFVGIGGAKFGQCDFRNVDGVYMLLGDTIYELCRWMTPQGVWTGMIGLE